MKTYPKVCFAIALIFMVVVSLANASPGRELVRFYLPGYLNAEAVYLAGEFNGWNPKDPQYLMAKDLLKGGWVAEVELESGHKYQYKFVIYYPSGKVMWKEDPNADEYVPDGFGGVNSVVYVGLPKPERYPKIKLSGSFTSKLVAYASLEELATTEWNNWNDFVLDINGKLSPSLLFNGEIKLYKGFFGKFFKLSPDEFVTREENWVGVENAKIDVDLGMFGASYGYNCAVDESSDPLSLFRISDPDDFPGLSEDTTATEFGEARLRFGPACLRIGGVSTGSGIIASKRLYGEITSAFGPLKVGTSAIVRENPTAEKMEYVAVPYAEFSSGPLFVKAAYALSSRYEALADKVLYTFEFDPTLWGYSPETIEEVRIVGDFNGWDYDTGLVMEREGDTFKLSVEGAPDWISEYKLRITFKGVTYTGDDYPIWFPGGGIGGYKDFIGTFEEGKQYTFSLDVTNFLWDNEEINPDDIEAVYLVGDVIGAWYCYDEWKLERVEGTNIWRATFIAVSEDPGAGQILAGTNLKYKYKIKTKDGDYKWLGWKYTENLIPDTGALYGEVMGNGGSIFASVKFGALRISAWAEGFAKEFMLEDKADTAKVGSKLTFYLGSSKAWIKGEAEALSWTTPEIEALYLYGGADIEKVLLDLLELRIEGNLKRSSSPEITYFKIYASKCIGDFKISAKYAAENPIASSATPEHMVGVYVNHKIFYAYYKWYSKYNDSGIDWAGGKLKINVGPLYVEPSLAVRIPEGGEPQLHELKVSVKHRDVTFAAYYLPKYEYAEDDRNQDSDKWGIEMKIEF